jgi:phosphoesterase RecJ-like protein
MKKIIDIINNYNKFLITSHIDPEGDALGSQLALGRILEKRAKRVNIVNEQKPASNYNFLPGIEKITSILKEDFEVAIFLDSPKIERVGKVANLINFKNKVIVNIDHHISNTNFGDVNWVEEKSSSCGEMLYKLFKELKEKLDKEIALNLYTAIFADTGSFRYSNTHPQTHRTAARLLNYGIKPEVIFEKIYEMNTAKEVKLLGLALSRIQLTCNNKICWVKITKEMLKALKVELKKTDDFTNFARSIVGVEVAILFIEKRLGEIKVSFRSKGRVDVNRLAQFFGGGGHKRASGCLIKRTLDEAEKMVLKKAREAVR